MYNKKNNLNIKPFWRGVFGVFYVHTLFKAIRNDPAANKIQPASFDNNGLATGWIVVVVGSNMLGRIPNLANLSMVISLFTWLFFLPVQNYINSVNQTVNPSAAQSKWSFGQVFCLIYGVLLLALIIIGLTAAPNAG